MFDDGQTLQLKLYVQKVISNPRPINSQPHKREGLFVWCEDWEIIEILKYLFNGKEGYMGDPPPNRLKFNPLWSKEEIAMTAEGLKAKYVTADAIIEHLKTRRSPNVAAA